MISHEYQPNPALLIRMLVPTMIGLAGLISFVHVGLMRDLLPDRRPPMIGDHFISHQRDEFTRSNDTAEVLIIGDSSALMGVDAVTLGERLPGHPRVYNLGLFLGLPLDVYGEIAGDFVARHPGQVKAVVLLTTSWRLTDAKPVDIRLNYWRELRAQNGEPGLGSPDLFDRLLAITESTERFISRGLPFVAHQKIGVTYGERLSAANRLIAFNGTLVTEGSFTRTGGERMTWKMDDAARDQGAAIRNAIPRGVDLIFGIMPAPETTVSTNATSGRKDLMLAFNQSLQADALLTRIPATLPDGLFSDSVHLNARGQARFTDQLAHNLSEWFRVGRGEPTREKTSHEQP